MVAVESSSFATDGFESLVDGVGVVEPSPCCVDGLDWCGWVAEGGDLIAEAVGAASVVVVEDACLSFSASCGGRRRFVPSRLPAAESDPLPVYCNLSWLLASENHVPRFARCCCCCCCQLF